MVKTKTINEGGEILTVETEKFQKQPIVISQTQAKKLVKREMTEKQAEHVKKLVEANKAKYEAKKKEKEDTIKAEIDRRVQEEMKKQQEGKTQQVVVAPKRIYKKKPQVIIEESETESEESEEYVVVKKPRKAPVRKAEPEEEDLDRKIEAVKKIDSILQHPVNRYSSMIRF